MAQRYGDVVSGQICSRADSVESSQSLLGWQHPRMALQYEMMMLPLVWEARGICIEFWVRMMRIEEKGLLEW